MRIPQFHVFYGKYTASNHYYMSYAGETSWLNIIDAVVNDPEKPKLLTPAIVLNRFKEVSSPIGQTTVKNTYANIEYTTGFFALDLDDLGKRCIFVKDALFHSIDELLLVWISSSRKGLKAIGYNERLYNIGVEEYKKVYRDICEDIRKRTYAHSKIRINFDPKVGRPHQPIFLNSDKTANIRL